MSTNGSLSIFKNTTREQKLIFLSLSVGYITLFCPIALIPPFLPPEGAKHGVSSSIIGMIFSVSSLMSVLVSPFAGLMITTIGPKMVIIIGILFNGVFLVLFGLLENIDSYEWFVAGCFICMGLSYLGVATVYTATLTYISKMFPGNMSLVVGITEMYIAVAEIIALLSGGFLYDLGGYQLPFILFGCLHLLAIPMDLILLPVDKKLVNDTSQVEATPLSTINLLEKKRRSGVITDIITETDENVNSLQDFSLSADEDKQAIVAEKNDSKLPSLIENMKSSLTNVSVNTNATTEKQNTKSNNCNTDKKLIPTHLKNGKAIPEKVRLWHLLVIPRTMLMSFVVLLTGISWSFLKSTLEPHLSPLNLNKTETNLVFLLVSVMYGISSPFWGWFSERVPKTWLLMSIGMIIAGITFGFLGPLPFLGLKNTLWLNIVCLFIISSTLTAAGVPAAEATLLYALEAGHKDDIDTYAIVSSLIATMYCAGAAIGSFAGGFLLEYLGYEISSGICGSVGLFLAMILLSYFVLFHNKPTPSSPNSSVEEILGLDDADIESSFRKSLSIDKPIVPRRRKSSAGSLRCSSSFISTTFVPVYPASPNLNDPDSDDSVFNFNDSRLSMI